MTSFTYLCTRCGTLRRSSVRPVPPERRLCSPAIRCCGGPMRPLTEVQGVAATHADAAGRVQWARHGLHIYERGGKRNGGKRKWMPAVTAGQAGQAQDQYAGYLARRQAMRQKAMRAYQHSRMQKRPQPLGGTV